jgi:hypothetical protein
MPDGDVHIVAFKSDIPLAVSCCQQWQKARLKALVYGIIDDAWRAFSGDGSDRRRRCLALPASPLRSDLRARASERVPLALPDSVLWIRYDKRMVAIRVGRAEPNVEQKGCIAWVDRIQKNVDGLPCHGVERSIHGLEKAVVVPVDQPREIEQPLFVTEAGIDNEGSILQVGCFSRRESPVV